MRQHAESGGTTISFEEDYTRLKSLNKLLSRFGKYGETNSRLLLNHCTVLFNMFGDHTYRLMEIEVNPDNYRRLVSALIFMQRVTRESEYDESFLEYLEKTCL